MPFTDWVCTPITLWSSRARTPRRCRAASPGDSMPHRHVHGIDGRLRRRAPQPATARRSRAPALRATTIRGSCSSRAVHAHALPRVTKPPDVVGRRGLTAFGQLRHEIHADHEHRLVCAPSAVRALTSRSGSCATGSSGCSRASWSAATAQILPPSRTARPADLNPSCAGRVVVLDGPSCPPCCSSFPPVRARAYVRRVGCLGIEQARTLYGAAAGR